MMQPQDSRALVLASASRWRRQLMEKTGLPFSTIDPAIDEKAIRHPFPEVLTLLIAQAKAWAALSKVGRHNLVIASDQVAYFRDEVREKPCDADEARRFLREYRNGAVELVTSIIVVDAGTIEHFYGCRTISVQFGPITDEAIEEAIARGDVLHSCGAAVVEDPAVAPWARVVEADMDAVQGFPLDLLYELLRKHRYPVP